MAIIVAATIAYATITHHGEGDDPDEPARNLAGPGTGSAGAARGRCRLRRRASRASGRPHRAGDAAGDAARRAALPADGAHAVLPAAGGGSGSRAVPGPARIRAPQSHGRRPRRLVCDAA